MFAGTHHMLGIHGFGWIFWILILLAGVWLVSRLSGGNRASDGDATASTDASSESQLDTLQRRYASGEISTEKYEERKHRLERDG